MGRKTVNYCVLWVANYQTLRTTAVDIQNGIKCGKLNSCINGMLQTGTERVRHKDVTETTQQKWSCHRKKHDIKLFLKHGITSFADLSILIIMFFYESKCYIIFKH